MKEIGTKMLQTERLILRRFVESDAETMFQNWASSAENLTYVTWNPHPDVGVTRNSSRNSIASYANPNYYKWVICLKEKPEQVIGDISIVEMDEIDSSCEIGYVLGKDYWGRGIMTEALKAVLDFCFTQAGFQKVRARYASLNPASGRVMEKAGMSYLKTIANGVERKDCVADLIYYQISREDR
ncbi:GNAT family N-acetyltransferase [Streptococcus sp. Marseille-Q5986]|uniref:GNAT family N-acetyltransferase n=1 Tax=Streptococcus sp. Marseille-Q5986 TaxID=2972782 RepID=UPI00226515DB|nr:GNAT family N-acetyltransferase [Streptococcus sp. Marseille-Q5986]